jgi:hypothetical protein
MNTGLLQGPSYGQCRNLIFVSFTFPINIQIKEIDCVFEYCSEYCNCDLGDRMATGDICIHFELYVYIHMYIYIYKYIYIHVDIYMRKYMHIYIKVRIFMYTYSYVYIYIYIYIIHINILTWMYICKQGWANMFIVFYSIFPVMVAYENERALMALFVRSNSILHEIAKREIAEVELADKENLKYSKQVLCLYMYVCRYRCISIHVCIYLYIHGI